MKKFAIAIHGGAGEATDYVWQNKSQYEAGIQSAVEAAHKILIKGGTAIDAVEEAVRNLEDNPLFNSGRGSALNNKGEVEMDAAIMDGNKVKAGAVSMVRNVKNPITLARFIMENSQHVFLSGD